MVAIAVASVSLCKNRLYFNFSVEAPGLVSALKIGLQKKRRNPQWNSISCLEGTISLFSIVRLILNDIVDSFTSFGYKVLKITALPYGNNSISESAISRTTVR